MPLDVLDGTVAAATLDDKLKVVAAITPIAARAAVVDKLDPEELFPLPTLGKEDQRAILAAMRLKPRTSALRKLDAAELADLVEEASRPDHKIALIAAMKPEERDGAVEKMLSGMEGDIVAGRCGTTSKCIPGV